jgi:hypothetical protein
MNINIAAMIAATIAIVAPPAGMSVLPGQLPRNSNRSPRRAEQSARLKAKMRAR